MPPEQPNQYMVDFQAAELARIENKAILYEQKLASVKEMTNVFLVALMCFYAVWVPFLIFEVQHWTQATWTALSIASTLAVGLLMVYILLINGQYKNVVSELYARKMGSGGFPMSNAPQQQFGGGAMGWMENKTGVDLNRDGQVGNPFFQAQRPPTMAEQLTELPPPPVEDGKGQEPKVVREKQ